VYNFKIFLFKFTQKPKSKLLLINGVVFGLIPSEGRRSVAAEGGSLTCPYGGEAGFAGME
jgi:hypothetical protein